MKSPLIEMEIVSVEDNAETESDKARMEKENIDFNNTMTETHNNNNVELDHRTDHVYHKRHNDEAEIQKQPGVEKSECLIDLKQFLFIKIS